MARTSNPTPVKAKLKLGLRVWMERVLKESDRAAAGFDPDPVHDLRVGLRRCRSLADGMMAMDADPSWRRMKKAGKKLFKSLGDLRDMHVLQEWIEKLSDPGDPVTQKLLDHVRAREAQSRDQAMQELDRFDRKQWGEWSESLPRRAARVRPGSLVFKHLALEKWMEAHQLHKRAMRSPSPIAFHQLRIGIKHFRYTVENFLPRQHAGWGDDLKELQDLLGDVHDYDVLWNTAVEIGAFSDAESRSRWRDKLDKERSQRIEQYRDKMAGKLALWPVWRAELPSAMQIRAAGLTRLHLWASSLDPDFQHSQRVAQIALSLYDGLQYAGVLRENTNSHARAILHAAALLHDVGRARKTKGHHKASQRMIRKLPRPLGWSARELELAAVVARYHRGGLPRPGKKVLQRLEIADRRTATQLAGILRLATALDIHDGEKPQLEVALNQHSILLQVAGYSPLGRSAENIAAARHLLETVLHRPVIVRRFRPAARRRSEGRQRLRRR